MKPRSSHLLLLCLIGGAATAQQPAPLELSEPVLRQVPRLRLTYYINNKKEIDTLELTGWTPDKDVIISGFWTQAKMLPVPGARSPDEPRGTSSSAYRRRSVPLRRAWEIIYVDAATEGQSHLIVSAYKFPRFSERILGPDDVISFLHVPERGWHQLGKAERAYREFVLELQEEQQNRTPEATGG